MRLLLLATLFFAGVHLCAAYDLLAPREMTLKTVIVHDRSKKEPDEYLLMIDNYIAFKTVEDMEDYLKTVPKGSTLTYAASCLSKGLGERELLSKLDAKFKAYCESIGVKFKVLAAG